MGRSFHTREGRVGAQRTRNSLFRSLLLLRAGNSKSASCLRIEHAENMAVSLCRLLPRYKSSDLLREAAYILFNFPLPISSKLTFPQPDKGETPQISAQKPSEHYTGAGPAGPAPPPDPKNCTWWATLAVLWSRKVDPPLLPPQCCAVGTLRFQPDFHKAEIGPQVGGYVTPSLPTKLRGSPWRSPSSSYLRVSPRPWFSQSLRISPPRGGGRIG